MCYYVCLYIYNINLIISYVSHICSLMYIYKALILQLPRFHAYVLSCMYIYIALVLYVLVL